jgi:hypothetical protein
MRPKLSYANVMATIAVFIALGGASYAALKVPQNSVGAKQLKKNAVVTTKVKNEAITAAKVKKGTLTGAQINASTLGTVPVANLANSVAPPEPWHEIGQPGQPLFMNNWSNFETGTSTAAFYKDTLGVVHLKGIIEGSKDSTAAFFLPVGFRPAKFSSFPTVSTSPLAVITVGPNGEVRPACNVSGCAPPLDGITFRAET